MLVPENMRGQNIGILGLGKSGLAAQKSLSAAGANLFVFDDFETNIQLPNLKKIKWENWPWNQLNAMVISPGIPHLHPTPHPAAEIARSKSVEIISEVEVALRAKPKAKHIAITGTNGKSTTTALLGHALEIAGIKTAVGGNIGDPVCSLTDPGHNGMIVLELSSYQLETTPSIAPHISILLNISPDHLERHGGMRGYVASKETIIKKTRENGVAIVGIGDNFTKNIAKSARNRGILVLDANPAIAAKSLQESIVLAGNHNAENVAAVSQALNFIGVDGHVVVTVTESTISIYKWKFRCTMWTHLSLLSP